MGTNKIKSLSLEQFKNKYEEVIPHLCYVDPRCEEYCHDAKDLTNDALMEVVVVLPWVPEMHRAFL